jgi:hypothetical protein
MLSAEFYIVYLGSIKNCAKWAVPLHHSILFTYLGFTHLQGKQCQRDQRDDNLKEDFFSTLNRDP